MRGSRLGAFEYALALASKERMYRRRLVSQASINPPQAQMMLWFGHPPEEVSQRSADETDDDVRGLIADRSSPGYTDKNRQNTTRGAVFEAA